MHRLFLFHSDHVEQAIFPIQKVNYFGKVDVVVDEAVCDVQKFWVFPSRKFAQMKKAARPLL